MCTVDWPFLCAHTNTEDACVSFYETLENLFETSVPRVRVKRNCYRYLEVHLRNYQNNSY